MNLEKDRITDGHRKSQRNLQKCHGGEETEAALQDRDEEKHT